MAWVTPRTWVDQEVVTVGIMNQVRDNFLALDQHGHSGSAGDGGTTLGNLTKETFTDASAPDAPGAGKTVVYTVSGRPTYRAGGAGASVQLADADDLHAQAHATAHEPSGADTMSVDAVTGTGSLRTLGTGAQQAAAGDHTHTTSDEYSDHSDLVITTDCSSEADIATHARTVGATGRSWAMYAGGSPNDSTVTYTLRLKFDTSTRVTRSGITGTGPGPPRMMEFLEVNPSAAPHTVRLTGEVTAGGGNTNIAGNAGVIEVSVA